MQEIKEFNKIFVANWKLNGSFSLINTLIRDIEIGFSNQNKECIIICPPFPFIKDLKSDKFFKGAQDCSIYSRGAYTGEIGSEILKSLDCQFCIVGHSESVNITFEKDFELNEIRSILESTEGVIVLDNSLKNEYPMPINAQNKDEVFVGRIRKDFSLSQSLNMWIVSDNLRKGAATNTVQIAEYLINNNLV